MKETIKALALSTTGLVVGVVVGRVARKDFSKKKAKKYLVTSLKNKILVEKSSEGIYVSYIEDGQVITKKAKEIKV